VRRVLRRDITRKTRTNNTSAGFRNVEALGPSLGGDSVFQLHVSDVSTFYLSAFDVSVLLNLLRNNILFESKAETNELCWTIN